MKKVELTKNQVALVDDEDFKFINQWKWHLVAGQYAARREYPSRKYLYMHRVILNAPHGKEVDHRNGVGLDNRKQNLRLCNRSENNRNTTGKGKNKTSRFKGVDWSKNRVWRARIQLGAKQLHIGSFHDEREAAEAYNEKARIFYGEFAYLNPI